MRARTPFLLLPFLALSGCQSTPAPPVSQPVFVRSWGSLGKGPGQFDHPFGIAIDASDFVYVADQHNERVQKFTPDGEYMTEWSTAREGVLSHPTGIAVTPSGDILVAEHQRGVISRWTNRGTRVTEFRCTSYPIGVTTDPSGNIYVVGGRRVQKFRPSGDRVKGWGSRSEYGRGYESPYGAEWHDGRLWVAEQDAHRYIALDGNGATREQMGRDQLQGPEGAVFWRDLMIVCDTGANRILEFRNGEWILTMGGYGQFYTPSDVAVNSKGEMFVVEWNNHRVQKFRL